MKNDHLALSDTSAAQRPEAFRIDTIDEFNCHYLHPHPEQYAVLLLKKGRGTYLTAERNGLIGKDHLLFLQPDELINLTLSGRSEGVLICFHRFALEKALGADTSFQQLLAYLKMQKQVMRAQTGVMVDIEQTLERMNEASSKEHAFRTELQFTYLKIFLMYAIELPKPDSIANRSNRNQQLADQFFELVDHHFRLIKMVSGYAEKLAITPNYLNEVIKKETGHSAGHHIRSRIVREAKQHASQSDIGMKAIAYDLGFLDMAHFSKFFKNTTGYNFSEFKKREAMALPN